MPFDELTIHHRKTHVHATVQLSIIKLRLLHRWYAAVRCALKGLLRSEVCFQSLSLRQRYMINRLPTLIMSELVSFHIIRLGTNQIARFRLSTLPF